jgi:NAD(P)H-dependent flavin oxidoreductase YrpB (nitropropane dioxygenase family)
MHESRSLVDSRYGAVGVWVGTRFVASVEAGAPKAHKELVLSAGFDDVTRTTIYSGRPMHVRKTPYVADWYVILYTAKQRWELKEMCPQGRK